MRGWVYKSDKGVYTMILLLILAFFVSFSQDSGIQLGTDNCHVGARLEPTAAIYALCYVSDDSHDTGA